MNEALKGRRREMSATTDSRAQDTRRRLADALLRNIEAGVEDNSVAALARSAGVGRSTFYTHFATVEELAVFVVEEFLGAVTQLDIARRLERTITRSTITRLGLEQVVDRFYENREVILYASRRATWSEVQARIVQRFSDRVLDTLAVERSSLDLVERRLLADFISAGSVHLTLHWLRDPQAMSREQLIAALFESLPTWLRDDSPPKA